jgi:endoglucanase
MKKNWLIFLLSISCLEAYAQNTSNVRFNSLGFVPQQMKEATIIKKCDSFVIKDAATHEMVFAGKTRGPIFQQDVNQEAWIADFSGFTNRGNYYIELSDGEKSAAFPVNENVYNEPFETVMRGFYLWRCGTDVHGKHNGEIFSHAACHLDDGYDDYLGNKGFKRDGTGGWHDAGDYGKYVVNAGITLGILFMAWEHFQPGIEKISLDIPDTAPKLPDYLKELKWETDWILKMQYPDGSGRVSHKLTRVEFAPFIMPEEDKEKRYFTEWSSAATADFVAITAMAARIFASFDKAYAEKCLKAARLSYQYLKAHPENKPFVQGDFKTGGYQTSDEDDRLWAAAEMWQTTGEEEFLRDFEKRASKMNSRIDEDWDWGNVSNLGMFTYSLCERKGKNKNVEQTIRQNIIAVAQKIVNNAQKDIYRRPLKRYYWGCNGTVARQTINLFVADCLNYDKVYKETASDAVAHLFGRNYYNRSYVTGIGINPPMHPHDRRSGADKNIAPWPGYLVGGGHTATDWVDEQNDYARNEIAINWQAPLVFALGWMLK